MSMPPAADINLRDLMREPAWRLPIALTILPWLLAWTIGWFSRPVDVGVQTWSGLWWLYMLLIGAPVAALCWMHRPGQDVQAWPRWIFGSIAVFALVQGARCAWISWLSASQGAPLQALRYALLVLSMLAFIGLLIKLAQSQGQQSLLAEKEDL